MDITFASAGMFTIREIVLDERTVAFLWSINNGNRRGSPAREVMYGASVKEGRWCEANPESMMFIVNDSLTRLIDGQTRLSAIRASGRYGMHGILAIVPDDKAADVFHTIDTGRARSSGQTLTAMGIANANNKAAAVRAMVEYVERLPVIDQTLVNEFVSMADPLLDALPLRSHKNTGMRAPGPFYSGVLNGIRLGLATVEEAVGFVNAALSDAGGENDACRQASRLIQRIQTRGARNAPRKETISTITHYLALHVKGQTIGVCRFDPSYDDKYHVGTPSPWILVDIAKRYADAN